MSSHFDWVDEICARHDSEKPFSPENGEELRFNIGDKVVCTNEYGAEFILHITGIYKPDFPCPQYAQGARYYVNSSCSWVPVTEASLRLA